MRPEPMPAEVAVPLHDGNVAIIDFNDLDFIAEFSSDWICLSIGDKKYAACRDGGVLVLMHRLLCDAGDLTVDHVNGDGLDNRKANLRPATMQQQRWNSKSHKGSAVAYKGVTARYGKYHAEISISGKRFRLGSFDTADEAALAYNVAAVRLQGEFARLNVVP